MIKTSIGCYGKRFDWAEAMWKLRLPINLIRIKESLSQCTSAKRRQQGTLYERNLYSTQKTVCNIISERILSKNNLYKIVEGHNDQNSAKCMRWLVLIGWEFLSRKLSPS